MAGQGELSAAQVPYNTGGQVLTFHHDFKPDADGPDNLELGVTQLHQTMDSLLWHGS